LVVQEISRILRTINRKGVSMLLVEQNANIALELADYAYLIETGCIVMGGPAAIIACDHAVRRAYLAIEGEEMQGFLHQLLSGVADGGIYASLARALVMIYRANSPRQFRAGRNGDVLNLHRLGDDRCRLSLLGGFRPHPRFFVRCRCSNRTDHHPAGGTRAGAEIS
jgi:hypothetical protein